MKAFPTLIVALLIVIALIAGILFLNAAFPTPGERAARDARAQAGAQARAAWADQADERAELFSLFAASLAAITVLTAAGIGAALVRLALVRSETLHAHRDTALYPAVRVSGQWLTVNEQGAQSFAALPQRPTAALARALIGTERATGRGAPQIIDASAEPVESPFDGAVDLVNRPHTILLGRTGSGKSTAGYAIADAIRRRYPAEFVIAEPGGVSWGSQCQAADVREIASVLQEAEQEMRRRQALLVQYDTQHILELPNPPPFLVILLEELEDTLDTLRLLSQSEAQRAKIALRNIAREGRKPGVCLLGITQFGKSDVLDSHVRHNMGQLYLFQNSANVGEMLRLPPTVRLDRLPVGTAYSFHASRLVQFPKAARPMLPARSVTPGDTPSDTQAVTEAVITPVTPPNGHFSGVITPDVTPMPTEPGTPTEAQRQAVLDAYRRAGSLRATQRALFPGQVEGGHWFYWIRSICQDAGIL